MTKPRLYLLIAKIITILSLSIAILNFHLLTVYNFLITKLVIIFFFVAFIDLYVKEIMEAINKIRNHSRAGPTIDGLPTQQIFDLLMDHGWLPAKIFLQNISSDKAVYKILWDNLERAGILIRWQKNARILNNQYTANQVFSILTSTANSDKLSPGLIKISEHSYKFANHRLEA